MSDAQINTLRLYHNVSNAAVGMDAYQCARRLGILDALQTGQLTAAQIASKCNLNPDRLTLLLNILCGLLILEKYSDDYALSQMMQLLTSHDIDLGRVRRGGLDQFVQSTDPCDDQYEVYRNRITSTQWQAGPAALEIVKYLQLSEQDEPLQIIDIGCATGVWSLSIARHDPQSTIAFVDTSEPLATASGTAESIGMTGRFTLIQEDPFSAELPTSQFNLAVIANLLHLIRPEQWGDLLLRAKDALKPGGRLLIIDVFPGQDNGDISLAAFELDLAMHVPAGALCDPLALQQSLVEIGFDKPRYGHIDAAPHIYGLLVAAKTD